MVKMQIRVCLFHFLLLERASKPKQTTKELHKRVETPIMLAKIKDACMT